MSAKEPTPRPLLVAELLSVGTEITVGETLDTNAAEIARSLVAAGVRVGRLTAVPDDLELVANTFRDALSRADLVVSTGGLGPTPDDLTREAVALVLGETPSVDPALLAWLEDLWARRGLPFPATNVKQAWVIPSAEPLPNPNGTAPGWFVNAAEGRVIVALPGPPREMRPMWSDEAWPRLRERGVGRGMVVRTLRLSGIGESQVADLLGETLRATNPVVATYARHEAVDVRISAFDEPGAGDRPARPAAELADAAEAAVLALVGEHVWARGTTSWAEAVDAALAARGLTLATTEIGTQGALATLLAETTRRRYAEIVEPAVPEGPAPEDEAVGPTMDPPGPPDEGDTLAAAAVDLRQRTGVDVGLAARARPRGRDMVLRVAIATDRGVRTATRAVFLSGSQGRHRAGISAALVLLRLLEAEAAGAAARP